MKKKLIKVALFGALTLAAGASFVGCKDYDDDINKLQEQITANKTAIEKLQALVGEGKFITGVTKTSEGLVFSVSNGGSSITIPVADGKDGSVIEIGENGNWFIDGKDTGKPSKGANGADGKPGTPGTGTPGTPGKDGAYYVPNADGYWHKIDGTTDTKTTQTWLPEGTLTAVCDGQYVTLFNIAGYPNGLKLNMKPLFVSSLSYVPTNIDTQLGEVAFFPVIGTDDDSKSAAKYEYNLSNKAYATTIINGWCNFSFKVNPADVVKASFEAEGFVADAAYTAAKFSDATTRALPATNVPTLNVSSKKEFDYTNNVMTVKASANNYKLVKAGNVFDDPNGIDASPEFEGTIDGNKVTYVNTVALQVKNVGVASSTGLVTSQYIPVKRMVVPQKYLAIGLNKTKDMESSLTLTHFRDLVAMYSTSATNSEIQTYLGDESKVPVQLYVPFTGTTELSKLIEGYATQFVTNTGFDAARSQYHLTKLGFDAPRFEYTVAPYEKAQVDQTMRYLQLASNGDISFDQANTAAIEREPVIKVQMYIGETLVMSKLLKIKVMRELQVPGEKDVDDIKDIVMGCNLNTQSIDFDQIFNFCGFSKAQFVEAYSNNGHNEYVVLVKKAGTYVKYTKGDITIVGAGSNNEILGSALTQNNKVAVNTSETVEPGEYAIQMTFNANATSVKYSPLVVTEYYKVSRPTISANINTTYWKNGNAQFNVQAPNTAFNPDECIFDADLNIYFLTTANGKAKLTYSPVAPTTGDYSCAVVDYIFAGSTLVDANGKTYNATVTSKEIKVGNDVVATIDANNEDHIVLTNSSTVKTMLSTGKFTINNARLQVTLPNGSVEVKTFNIDVVRPLDLGKMASGSFTDAQNFGDNLGFDKIIAMTDWRGQVVTIPGATPAGQLGIFYDVTTWATTIPFILKDGTMTLDNTKIKTNLKKDANGDWTPDASVTAGNATVTLPAGTNLTVNVIDGKYNLNYKTNMGTVTKEYKMWIPVQVGYKWGQVLGTVEVTVKPVIK